MSENELALNGKYERMIEAIADCHSVDECKETANRAEALAAYARQVRDDGSLKQYLEIKIRAWRRIGELLCEVVGIEPTTATGYGGSVRSPSVPNDALRRMRATFTCDLTDLEIRRAVAVASIDGDFFEQQAQGGPQTPYHIFQAYSTFLSEQWLQSPDGVAYSRDLIEERERRRASLEKLGNITPYSGSLTPGPDTITVAVVMSRKLHEMLRTAAFERKVTQQYLIRSALVEWLIDKTYDPPDEDGE